MNAVRSCLMGTCMTLTVVCGHASAAQDTAAAPSPAAQSTPAAKRSAQLEAGEPRANASQPAAVAASAPAGAAASAEAAPASAAAPGAPPASRSAATAAPARTQVAAADRLDLGSSTVTGNQELPKVMYIVPWKKSDIGDLAGKPMNSLLDEVLAPVDRDVFRREVRYYDAVKADAAPGAKAEPAPQVEK